MPDVPVMTMLYCPRLAVLLAVSVTVQVPVVGFGANDAVTPLGKPDAEKATLPVNPYSGYIKTVAVPELAWPMLSPYVQSVKLWG